MRLRIAALGAFLVGCQQIVGIEDYRTGANPPVDSMPCVAACDGRTLITCVDGAETRGDCALGCSPDGTPHCAALVPSNVTAADLEAVAPAAHIVAAAGVTYSVDTDTGEVINRTGGDVVVRSPTPDGGVDLLSGTYFRRVTETVSVLAVDSIIVENSAVVRALGSRGLVLLSRGPVRIEGELDFLSRCEPFAACSSPGGGRGGLLVEKATGCAPGGNVNVAPSIPGGGGGGGGFGSAGASGGMGSTGRPGAGGAVSVNCSDVDLIPLQGGSGGGYSGFNTGFSYGGAGGGALQITSLASIVIDGSRGVPAILDLGGGGGLASSEGFGGGGSGGGILLEAPTVSIGPNAIVVANGGGGAGNGSGAPVPGANGSRSAEPAAGGGTGVGAGGRGGALDSPAAAGTAGNESIGGGGGGGGVGIIRINSFADATLGGVVSPAPSTGPLSTR